MKRRTFLASSGAATLAACSGGGGSPQGPSRTVPVATASPVASAGPNATSLGVPQSVLSNPILGESFLTTGTAQPPGSWMTCSGQSLQIAQYPDLFRLLGTIFGGDGKKTFLLPKTSLPAIVAIAGYEPQSPQSLEQFSRRRAVARKEIGNPAPFRIVQKPPAPAFEIVDAPTQAPPIGSISEHARFAQVLAMLELDGMQQLRIANLTDRARASASTPRERGDNVLATMAIVRDQILRDDQRATLAAEMAAWKSAHG